MNIVSLFVVQFLFDFFFLTEKIAKFQDDLVRFSI